MLQKLFILHTNDIHSFFEQMPRIASVIHSYRRSRRADELLVLDCGDHMDRARPETEGSGGQANIAIMNATGYDAAVMGNNEGLTFTKDTLAELYGRLAGFPLIGSNMFELESGVMPEWVQPYRIVRKGQLNIGIIGVTINFTSFYTLLGWDVRDPLQIVAKLVEEIRPHVHIVIVVSHLGLANDESMARQISGIDCILGGHTHHLLEEPEFIGHTYICGAGKFGTHVGKLEFDYDWSQRRIVKASGCCIPTADFAESSEITEIIHTYQKISQQRLSQVEAHLELALPIAWNEETTLGNLLVDGIRDWVDAEIGLVNAGQLLTGLHAGAVTRGELLKLCPSPINPCKMLLTGAEVREALEQSLLAEYIHKPIRGYGFRGKELGVLCVSGLRIEVDRCAEAGHKVRRVWLNGKEVSDDQDIRVGTIDMFTFGAGYTPISHGRDIQYFLPEFLRDVLMEQLKHKERIALGAEKRWIDC